MKTASSYSISKCHNLWANHPGARSEGWRERSRERAQAMGKARCDEGGERKQRRPKALGETPMGERPLTCEGPW